MIQKKSHSSKSESEDQFKKNFDRQIIQNLPGALYICDANGRITFYNQPAVDLWGREPVLGEDLWCGSWKIYRSDGVPLPLESCPMAITLKEGREVNNLEIIIERPDGALRNILPHPKPILDADGKVIGAFNMLEDITEKKMAEERIREGDYFMRGMISSSNDCIKILDLNGNLISMNEGGIGMLEIEDIAPFIGSNWVDFWNGEDRKAALLAVETAISGGIGKFVGFYPSLRSHTSLWWDVVITPILDKNGLPERLLAISRNITEQKLLQEELRDKNKSLEIVNRLGKTISSELELRNVVQSVTDASTELSGAEFGAFFYNVTDENGESYTLYTISGVEKEAFSKFPMPRKTKIFAPTFNGKGIVRSDDITKDPRYGKNAPYHGMPKGHLPVVSYLAIPVISRTGEVIGGLFFGHSKPGAFTQKTEDNLSAIASQAAIAMDNSKLYEASKADKEKLAAKNDELQRTNVDLDNFIYTASHDLKAPVSNIEGLVNTLSDMLKEEMPPKEELNSILSMVNLSINRFSKTIKDLTTITKIQKETDERIIEKVKIAEVIEDIKLTSRELIINAGAKIILKGDECCEIKFSRKNLESILYNLISNAIKYRSPDRVPEVIISTEKENGYIILTVTDNGLGLAKDKQEKLFSMFKRFHDHVEGTGIGLYLVKRIITNAGGKIEVESAVNAGSTFKVYLKE